MQLLQLKKILRSKPLAKSSKTIKSILIQCVIIVTGIGLLSLSTFIALNNNFLFHLILNGGSKEACIDAVLTIFSFIGGLILIVRHIVEEGISEGFSEYPQ